MHKFPRWFIIFSRMLQFSDTKGRRFESCQPHQIMSLYCRTATFLFCHGSCLSIHFVTMYAAILAMTDSKTDKIVHREPPFRDALPVFFAFGLGEIVQRPLLFENPIYNHITVLYWLYRQKDFIPVKAALKPA